MSSTPAYNWTCHACGKPNQPGKSACLACGRPAVISGRDLALARDIAAAAIDDGEARGRRSLALVFTGRATEYFRIWIVNLCLTLLTLGVFSAWAKVRKKRYFYSHTVLDGSPFQYLAEPLPILKGRIVAVALFLVYYAARHFFLSLLPIVAVIALAVAPWAVARSAAFNARYSAYRNLNFGFKADYWRAVWALYWMGLVPVVAVGTVFTWWGKPQLAAVALAIFGFLFPWWLARLRTFLVENTRYGGIDGELDVSGGQYWGIYFRGGLLIGLGGLLAGASAAAAGKGGALLVLPLMFVFLYLGYASGYAYIQAASGNLLWNNTRLGPLGFASSLRGRDLVWLYFTNALAILASCGLLTPWAVIRTLRYRADHMQVWLEGSLAQFTGSDTDTVKAAGAEVGQIFDLDLSL